MALESTINLQVEDLGPLVKLCWWYGPGHELSCIYKVSQPELVQAGREVREHLFRLVQLRVGARNAQEIDDKEYEKVYRSLLRRGQDLRDRLFRREGGGDDEDIERLKNYISEVARAAKPGPRSTDDDGQRPMIRIILCEGTINLPWSFVCIDDQPRHCEKLTKSILDFDKFWLKYFRLPVKYQNSNQLPLPEVKKNKSEVVFALHESLHASAYDELSRHAPGTRDVLDMLLASSRCCTDNWSKIEDHWRTLYREPVDGPNSVVYVMGHSDGEQILLKDGTIDADHVLPATSFCRAFCKGKVPRSASIVVLNACQSGAPSEKHWPPGFIKATWMKGFFGFVGTEIRVPNTLASMYGAHLLERLQTSGETLGKAFDAMLADQSLFPLSLAYTCFADRNFRLAETTTAIAARAGGSHERNRQISRGGDDGISSGKSLADEAVQGA